MEKREAANQSAVKLLDQVLFSKELLIVVLLDFPVSKFTLNCTTSNTSVTPLVFSYSVMLLSFLRLIGFPLDSFFRVGI